MVKTLVQSSPWLFVLCLVASGCGRSQEKTVERRPRPVITNVLTKQLPPTPALVTASANAWKTEDLGFEVAGRIEFVADQNTEIQGRIRDSIGELMIAGTPIARIESERYELGLAKAEAALARAEQDLSIGETELDETIPAQISAANASLELAKVEYERAKTLRARNAGSQSELDSAKATYENALAEIKQLVASEKTQAAQIESLKSAVQQAQQDVRDAKRDLEDCTLYSSFDGKVAESFVVPGSMVSAGKPVVKLQMMDPIKIELEVSAKQSRQLRRTEKIPVHVSMPNGSIEVCDGFLHQIDPSADPQTRTFTLTVLLMNQQLANAEDLPPTSTHDIWRLDLGFIPGAEPGQLFVEEEAILSDSDGHYLWQITNATIQSRSQPDQVFEVRRLRVTLGESRIPYLGELIFQQVQVEDAQFDPGVNLVVGKLKTSGIKPNEWNGGKVWLDSPNRWLLRPGDLVEIDLSGGDSSPGYFVPMDAICRKAGQSFLYVIESADSETIVRRVLIDVMRQGENTSSLRRITPLDDTSLDGIRYVTKGAHFLTDGEQVNVTATAEVTR